MPGSGASLCTTRGAHSPPASPHCASCGKPLCAGLGCSAIAQRRSPNPLSADMSLSCQPQPWRWAQGRLAWEPRRPLAQHIAIDNANVKILSPAVAGGSARRRCLSPPSPARAGCNEDKSDSSQEENGTGNVLQKKSAKEDKPALAEPAAPASQGHSGGRRSHMICGADRLRLAQFRPTD